MRMLGVGCVDDAAAIVRTLLVRFLTATVVAGGCLQVADAWPAWPGALAVSAAVAFVSLVLSWLSPGEIRFGLVAVPTDGDGGPVRLDAFTELSQPEEIDLSDYLEEEPDEMHFGFARGATHHNTPQKAL
jgi:hypothetical protein